MINLNWRRPIILWVKIFESSVASGAGGNNLFETHPFEMTYIVFNTSLKFDFIPNQVRDIPAAMLLIPKAV